MAGVPKEIHQLQLAREPQGAFKNDDFTVASIPVPELKDGQVLLRVVACGLDPVSSDVD